MAEAAWSLWVEGELYVTNLTSDEATALAFALDADGLDFYFIKTTR